MAQDEKTQGTIKISEFPDIEYHDRYLRKIMLIVAVIVSGFVSLWYLATFVYRAPFPNEQLSLWTLETNKISAAYGVPVSFHLHTSDESQSLGRQLMASLQGASYKTPKSKEHAVVNPVFYFHSMEEGELDAIRSTNVTSEGHYNFPELLSGVSDRLLEYHFVIVSNESDSEPPKIYLDEHSSRPVFYVFCPTSASSEKIGELLKDNVNKILKFLIKKSAEGMVVDYSPNYQLTFTVMYESPPTEFSKALDVGLPNLIHEQVSPFLSSLSPLSSFEVTSQTQFYSKLAFTPQKIPGYESSPSWYAIKQRQLPHFINNAEWDLASAVSTSPDLNLIIYVPSPSLTPLHIIDTKGNRVASNAFAIPQWGGVVIVNPTQGQISAQDVTDALTVHLQHLQELLGLVQAPFNPPQNGLRLSLDRLFLQKTDTLISSATKTLSALQALIVTITQMEVGDIIIAHTKASLNALSDARNALLKGYLMDALYFSRVAFQNAEFGFFHPTMVSQMYFPTDASYALFLPLLLPAVLPLVLGFVKSKRRTRAIEETK